MTNPRPDDETVRGAVALAGRAPSVHNTQPWRWLIGERTVHLVADWTRHVPVTDPDGRDLLISCGAALHHLLVALAAFGWAGAVHRIPNPCDPTHLAAVELHPHVASEEEIALAAAINRRRTDRRGFSSWPVPSGHLDLMIRRASQAGALLVPITDPCSRYQLTRAINAAVTHEESSPQYSIELAVWSGRSRVATDGVPAANSPATSTPHGDTRMRTFPHGTLTQSTQDKPTDDIEQLLVLATQTDDRTAQLRAGEAAGAVLLTATDLNLASCPLSQALEVADTRTTIHERVLDSAAIPQLILRIGWAHTAAKPLPQTPRRPLEEIIDVLPGIAHRR